ETPLANTFDVLGPIGAKIIGSLNAEIETAECRRAMLRPPNSLNAWEAHHRGLWHMYRFTGPDNERAQRYFERAIKLDSTFSRAFVHPLAECFSFQARRQAKGGGSRLRCGRPQLTGGSS